MRISDWSSDVCSSDLARPLEREAYRASGAGDTLQGIAAVDRGIAVRHAEGGDDDLAGIHVVDADARLVALNLHQPLVDCKGTDAIGSASCRDRVCQYVSISVVAVSLQTKQREHIKI